MDRLDRALRSEETLTPSAGFTAAVMAEVRREAEAPRPLPFPWRRVLAVLGLGLAVGAAGLALIFFGVLQPQTLTAWFGRLLASVGDAALLARLAAVLLLTFLTASLPRWLEV
jgi:hypothetical protein